MLLWNRATAHTRGGRARGEGRHMHTVTARGTCLSRRTAGRSRRGTTAATARPDTHSGMRFDCRTDCAAGANQQPPGIGTTAPIRAPMIPSMITHFAPEPQLVRTPTDRGACWPRGRAGRDGDARTTRCTQLPRTARKNSLTSRGIGLQTFASLHASTHLLLL